MGIFGNNYLKSGPGIAKDAPKKKPFFHFWELYFRKFWKLLQLNIITVLFCLPVVTIGPALAGMTKVLRNYVLEKNSFIFHDFWKGFSQNWKKSLPVGLIDILLIISAISAVNVYPALAENAQSGGWIWYAFCIISISVTFTVLIMNFYIFPMIIATDLSFKNCIKNSFFLTCVALKKNLITLLCVAAVMAVLVLTLLLNPYFLLLLIPLWAVSFIGFITMFNSYPIIQKYVINPYYEERGMDNPEYDYLKPLDEEDSVFVDKGGQEAPVEPEKKKKKGKTIS